MTFFEKGEVKIYFEEYGQGYPLLLIAPGGMRSCIDWWQKAAYNAIEAFKNDFWVIAMDQRNTGQSTAPITATDSWDDYTADQIGLLDYLGIDKAHIMGGCIGSSYCLGILKAIPERITAAVLQNPIGLSNGNRPVFFDMFNDWGAELKATRPDVTDEALAGFAQNMFGGEFVFNVSRDFVKSCHTPLLICAGNDQFHPTATAEEIDALAPNSEYILKWREPEVVQTTIENVRNFLKKHTP